MKTRSTNAGIPILIRCDPKDREGEAFLPVLLGGANSWLHDSSVPVRRFSDSDFKDATNQMRGNQRHLIALLHLQTAIAMKQEDGVAKARQEFCAGVVDSFREHYQRKDVWDEEDEAQLQALVKRVEQMKESSRNRYKKQPTDPFERCEWVLQRYRTEAASTIYAREMVNVLHGADLILWRMGTRFTPAFFCGTHHTAVYAMVLFGKRWRICPYAACGKWFVPRLPTQDYCCPQHREAHRVARWRERLKKKPKKR